MKKNKEIPSIIFRLLKRLPPHVHDLARDCIEIRDEERWVINKRRDGHYERDTGKIILWNPNPNDDLGLFIILTHEIGHKIYKELFGPEMLKRWLKICSQEPIEKEIQESYPSYIVPEEQYCWLTSIAACLNFFSKEMTNKLQRKEQKILKTNPQGYWLAKSNLKQLPVKNSSVANKSTSGIYHWQVEAVKKWLFGNSRIKNFP